MRMIMKALGDPQNQFRAIHVAGTSGKTSTCYYLASLLQASGKQVGLTVSPHVTGVTERIQVNLEPIAASELLDQLRGIIKTIEPLGIIPTYFELLVACAYQYFAKQNVEYAVIEVGLGGLLDGTNVINRADKVCVITDIGFDHMNILGNSLREIAIQKAGIIKGGNNVFMHRQVNEVQAVIERTCHQNNATLCILDNKKNSSYTFRDRNLSLAVEVVQSVLENVYDRRFAKIVETTKKYPIPGRLEVFHVLDKIIILDGAHNPKELSALFETISALYPNITKTVLVSMSERNQGAIAQGMKIVHENAKEIVVTTFTEHQDLPKKAVPIDLLSTFLKPSQTDKIANCHQALRQAINKTSKLLIVTGSLYLIAELRPDLETMPKEN
jgi:dihydrofolate synthase/folylpolyglutamate synthase